jgi:hypothetical protein
MSKIEETRFLYTRSALAEQIQRGLNSARAESGESLDSRQKLRGC